MTNRKIHLAGTDAYIDFEDFMLDLARIFRDPKGKPDLISGFVWNFQLSCSCCDKKIRSKYVVLLIRPSHSRNQGFVLVVFCGKKCFDSWIRQQTGLQNTVEWIAVCSEMR